MDDIQKIAQATLEAAGVHSVTIKNKKYTIELMPATQAFAVATQLMKVVLPAIGSVVDGTQKRKQILPEDDNLFMEAAVLFVGQLDNISTLDIITLLSNNITCDGNLVDIDQEFKGNLGGLITLLEFIIRENCGSLFQDWLEAKGIDLRSLMSQNLTPTTEDTSKA